jgi:Flp pilus assembly protein TadG
MTFNTRNKKSRQGATMVEFALSLPIVAVFFWASLEFARAAIIQHAVDNAAYEACRIVIVPGGTTSEATTAANEILKTFSIKDATVTVTPNPITEATTQITCEVSAPASSSMWGTPKFFSGKILNGKSTLIAERTPAQQATVLGP